MNNIIHMKADLIKKAGELLENPDMIIDLYDFTIVWMSEKLRGILSAGDELIGTHLTDMFAIPEFQKREKVMEHINKSHGFFKISLKSKDRAVVKFDVEFRTVEFNNGFYHIGKFIKYEKVPEKK